MKWVVINNIVVLVCMSIGIVFTHSLWFLLLLFGLITSYKENDTGSDSTEAQNGQGQQRP